MNIYFASGEVRTHEAYTHKILSLAPLTAREHLLIFYYSNISIWGLEPQTLSLEGSRAIQLRYIDCLNV